MHNDKNKQMIKKSKVPLSEANENYFQHMRIALKISFELLSGATTAFIHAFLPSIFTTNASKKIRHLYSFVEGRNKN